MYAMGGSRCMHGVHNELSEPFHLYRQNYCAITLILGNQYSASCAENLIS